MSNVKKGDLVRYIGNNETNRPNAYGWIGGTVSAGWHRTGSYWVVEPPMPGGNILVGSTLYGAHMVLDKHLAPIRDQPGNEAFVTEARNKLKGKTEISERGEVSA